MTVRFFLLIVFYTCFAIKSYCQTESLYNDSLRQSLVLLKQDASILRNQLDSVRSTFGTGSNQWDSLWNKIHKVDSANLAELKIIVNTYGWPGNRLVGSEGARAAFLLVQHADLDSTIQEQYLALLTKAAEDNDLEWQHVAYLTDRILIYKKGGKQLYGTQLKLDTKTNTWVPFEIEDEANVDMRREKMGMPPLESYLKMMNRR